MKTCAQCKSLFQIPPQQQHVLKELNLPDPTLCPDCRNIRRMAWRNDRTFYHGKSALSGKPIISMYPADTPYKIYLQSEWYGDGWDPLDYGRDFDFNRPFFDQFYELQLQVPRMNLDIVNCENSDYCNYCGDDKNCYLDIAGESNEDCYYDLFVKYSKNVVDSTFLYHSTHCYESINCHGCYNVKFGQYCNNSSDCFFAYDLIGCKNCLFSYNLRNKEFHIFNQPHTKEEYEKKRNEIFNGSHNTLQSALKIWFDHLKKQATFRDTYKVNCENCTGNNLKDCKKVVSSFNVTNAEDSSYLYDVLDAQNCSDLNYSLYKPELSYELISTLNMSHSAFALPIITLMMCFIVTKGIIINTFFGCCALTHKEYCILNKQYFKGEYEKLKIKIIDHMKSTGEWGQFFPEKYSPFGYNETVAQEYFPINKNEASTKGFKWSEEAELKKYKGPVFKIPDYIQKVDSSICKQVLTCEVSKKPYKIIEQELKFYKQHQLPVPHRSPQQRHLDRMAIRTPRKLWERKCAQCDLQISSTFDPNRPEKVYCEECYLKEVY